MPRPPQPSIELPLRETVSEFLNYAVSFRRCADSTRQAYAHDLGSFVAYCEGQDVSALASIDERLLVAYFSQLPPLAPNTIRRRAHALMSWLEFSVRQGLLPLNPARALQLPRRPRLQRLFPNPDETRALLVAARTPLERAGIWLLATAGLRRQELLDLDFASLAPDRTALTVRGKGGAERQVPLPPATQEVVGEYLALRGAQPGPLLLSRAGTRLGRTSLRRLFVRLARRAGLAERGYSLHAMRHSYATMLLRGGADLATVGRLLGHASLDVTSVYLHSDPATCRAAVDALPILSLGGEGRE